MLTVGGPGDGFEQINAATRMHGRLRCHPLGVEYHAHNNIRLFQPISTDSLVQERRAFELDTVGIIIVHLFTTCVGKPPTLSSNKAVSTTLVPLPAPHTTFRSSPTS